MPVPVELEGKQLIDSIWVRRIGTHKGLRWRLTKYSEAGVELQEISHRERSNRNRKNGIPWPMFMNLYQSEGNLDMKEVAITVDKEGYVQKVTREGTANGRVIVQDVPPVQTKVCTSGWHKGNNNVPITQFAKATRGPHKGDLAQTCIACQERNREWTRVQNEKKGRVKLQNVGIKPIKTEVFVAPETTRVIEAVTPPAAGPKARWKVTIIPAPTPITVEVEASDVLDAIIAAGEGRVIRVEEL